MTIVPRTGPLSASSAFATTSWYQRGKFSDWGVRTGAGDIRAIVTVAKYRYESCFSCGRCYAPSRRSNWFRHLVERGRAAHASVFRARRRGLREEQTCEGGG